MFYPAKIRQIRSTRKMTLEALSEATGFSRSYLSQIERSIVNPSLSALEKIADALNISISFLFENDLTNENRVSNYTVLDSDHRHKLVYPGSNIASEMLTPTLNKEFEFFWTTVKPGESSRNEPYNHSGYECGIIIQGTVEFHIGDEEVILTPGQSICFLPKVPHYWKNIGDCDVHAVWVITPSAFYEGKNN